MNLPRKPDDTKEFWERLFVVRTNYHRELGAVIGTVDVEDVIRRSLRQGLVEIRWVLMLLESQLEIGNYALTNKFMKELIDIGLTGNVSNTIRVREVLLKADRSYLTVFLQEHFDEIIARNVAEEGNEEWVYRRAMELFSVLMFFDCKKRIALLCERSDNEDVKVIATDY